MLKKGVAAIGDSFNTAARFGPFRDAGDMVMNRIVDAIARRANHIDRDGDTIRYEASQDDSDTPIEDRLYQIGLSLGLLCAIVSVVGVISITVVATTASAIAPGDPAAIAGATAVMATNALLIGSVAGRASEFEITVAEQGA